jgi:Tol biopolymer transport system component
MRNVAGWRALRLLAVAGVIAAAFAGPGAGAQAQRPGVTERVSVSSTGRQANSDSGTGEAGIAVTPDGRYVAFSSNASNLVAGDLNKQGDVFVHDRRTGKTVMASVPSGGVAAQATGTATAAVCPGEYPSISDNGRYVAFSTCRVLDGKAASGPVDNVWVRDLVAGTTTRVSMSYDGKPLLGSSARPSISADGRYVAFESMATGLVRDACPSDTVQNAACLALGSHYQIYVRDMLKRTTKLVSVSTTGVPADFDAVAPAISPDGRMVVFTTASANLVSNDHNVCLETAPTCDDVYVRDLRTSVTQLVSVDLHGMAAQADPFIGDGAGTASSTQVISADDRYVVFESGQSGLVPATTSDPSALLRNRYGVYVRDLRSHRTERVSVTSAGEPLQLGLGMPTIDRSGRYVAFDAVATCQTADAGVGSWSVAIHDRRTGETHVLDRVDAAGADIRCPSGFTSQGPVVVANGRYVAFASTAASLVRGDTNKTWDVFVRDRGNALGAGRVFAGTDATGAAPARAGSLGLRLTEATAAYRPALADVFVRLDLAGMPSFALTSQAIRYVVNLESNGAPYQLRVSGVAGVGGKGSFVLFRSTAAGWRRVGAVDGGYGTTGVQVVAAIPLRLLGATSPDALARFRAASQLADADGGTTTVETLTLGLTAGH